MWQNRASRGLLACAAVLWTLRAFGGADPTAGQLAQGWRDLGGGSMPAKIVYWELGAIRVLDLATGKSQSILQGKLQGVGEPSVGPYPVWSPDGTRISFYDGASRNRKVMNADGSNVKVVSRVAWTYGASGWWDNDWIVVVKDDANKSIARVRINANNDPVETVTVVGSPPYGGRGREWISMSGDYVAWTDWGANGAAGNRSIVRNWKTGKEHEVVPRSEDACSIVLKRDGSGTSIYSRNSHWLDEIQTIDGTIVAKWQPVDGGLIEMPRWSNHPDYICTMDFRQKKDFSAQRAWIRKATADGKPYLFLGWGMWGPDLWVDMEGGGPADTQPPVIALTNLVLGGTISDTTVNQIDAGGTPHAVVNGNWQTGAVPLAGDPATVVLTAADGGGNAGIRTLIVWTGSAPQALVAPTGLEASSLSDTEIFLSWVDNATAEEGFRVYRNEGSGFVALTTVPANTAGYMDGAVVAGRDYAYYVVAYGSSEESARSNEVNIQGGAPRVTVLAPATGQALTLGQMIDVPWTTNVPDLDVTVQLSLDNGATWIVLQPSWAPNDSPWPWKVGYKNSELDPSKPPVWQQVVATSAAACKLMVSAYTALSITGQSATFAIDVP